MTRAGAIYKATATPLIPPLKTAVNVDISHTVSSRCDRLCLSNETRFSDKGSEWEV